MCTLIEKPAPKVFICFYQFAVTFNSAQQKTTQTKPPFWPQNSKIETPTNISVLLQLIPPHPPQDDKRMIQGHLLRWLCKSFYAAFNNFEHSTYVQTWLHIRLGINLVILDERCCIFGKCNLLHTLLMWSKTKSLNLFHQQNINQFQQWGPSFPFTFQVSHFMKSETLA